MLRLLLTNDDGIDAPGLAALERAVRAWGPTTVLAPVDHHSGCSHRATTDRGLRLEARGPGRMALDGTPVDCTRVGLAHLDFAPDWVLSGVNEGGNLGADVLLSGTVAAAREAALLGRPAVAFSQYRRSRGDVDWERAARWTVRAFAWILEQPPRRGVFWNVNFPDPASSTEEPRLLICPVDPNPLPVRYREVDGRLHYEGRYQDRVRAEGHDIHHCFEGQITISELSLDGVRRGP